MLVDLNTAEYLHFTLGQQFSTFATVDIYLRVTEDGLDRVAAGALDIHERWRVDCLKYTMQNIQYMQFDLPRVFSFKYEDV